MQSPKPSVITEDLMKAEVRWGLLDVFFGIFGALLATITAVTVALTVFPPAEGETNFAGIAAGLIGGWVGFLGAPLIASYQRGQRSLAKDFGFRFKASDVPIGLGIGIAGQLLLVNAIYKVLKELFPGTFDDVSKSAERLTNFDGLQFGFIVLAVLIAAPFLEELFFRGLMQRAIDRRAGPAVAVVVSGLFFGLVHFNAPALPALVAFGLVLAYIAQKSGRLGLNIFAHVGFNLVTLVLLAAQRAAN